MSLMLFTGDRFVDPAWWRHGLGIEPMTCAPNALQTGEGLRILRPGELFSHRWGIYAWAPGCQRG
jgi:aldose 1-epimerase